MITSELQHHYRLVYKLKFVSSWRDRRTQIYLWAKTYTFSFIPRTRACLLLAICNRRVLFYITPLPCLRMHDVFRQRHLTTETCCKVWTHKTHCYSTRHVPRCVPRPCPRTTSVMKWRTDNLLAATRAAEAAIQETLCSCTRHVPKRVPRPCPCINNKIWKKSSLGLHHSLCFFQAREQLQNTI